MEDAGRLSVARADRAARDGSPPVVVPGVAEVDALVGVDRDGPAGLGDAVEAAPPGGPAVAVVPRGVGRGLAGGRAGGGVFEEVDRFLLAVVVDGVEVAEEVAGDLELGGL